MKWFDRVRSIWYNAREEGWLETVIEVLSIRIAALFGLFRLEFAPFWRITQEVEYLETLKILGIVGLVLASGGVTALCIAIWKKAHVREEEKVPGELETSNQVLHDEHSGLDAQNACLSDDAKPLLVDYGKLTASVDPLTRQAEKQDQQYAPFSVDQQGVSDAMDQQSVADAVDQQQLFARQLDDLAEEKRVLRKKKQQQSLEKQIAEAREKSDQYNKNRKAPPQRQELDGLDPER